MESCDAEKRKRPRTKSPWRHTSPIVDNYCPYSSGFLASRLLYSQRRPANYQWDCYYRNNTINGYKDRHYILREFVELQEAISSAASFSSSSTTSDILPSTKGLSNGYPYFFSWLEVGCGVGNAFLPIFEQYGHLPQWKRMYAVDISSVATDLLRKRIQNNLPSSLQQKVCLSTVDPSLNSIVASEFSPIFSEGSYSITKDAEKERTESWRSAPTASMPFEFKSPILCPSSSTVEDLVITAAPRITSSMTTPSTKGDSISYSKKGEFEEQTTFLNGRSLYCRGHEIFASLIFMLSSVDPAHHPHVVKNIAEFLEQQGKEKPGVVFFRDYAADDHAQLRFAQRRKEKSALGIRCAGVDTIEGDIESSLASEPTAAFKNSKHSTNISYVAHNFTEDVFPNHNSEQSSTIAHSHRFFDSSFPPCGSEIREDGCSTHVVPNDITYERANGTLSHFFHLQEVQNLFSSAGFETVHLRIIERDVLNRKQKKTHHRRFIQGRFAYTPLNSDNK